MDSESRILVTVNTPKGQIKETMERREFERLKQDKQAFQDFLRRRLIGMQAESTQERKDGNTIQEYREPLETSVEYRERSKRSGISGQSVEGSGQSVEGSGQSIEGSEKCSEGSEKCSEESEDFSQRGSGSWGKPATLFLISEHSKISKQVEAGKLTKKSMWQLISRHLSERGYEYTVDQVSGRWKSLNRAYKNTKDNNKKSGSGRKTFEYESEFDEIFKNDPSIVPEITMSSTKSDDGNGGENPQPPKKLRKRSEASNMASTVQNFLQEQERYRKEECERKERMHKEKLETLKSLIDVFTRKKQNEKGDSDD